LARTSGRPAPARHGLLHDERRDFDHVLPLRAGGLAVSRIAALSVHGLEAVGIDTMARHLEPGARYLETWRKAIAASPFTQVASHDDEVEVELDDGGGLLWHELVGP